MPVSIPVTETMYAYRKISKKNLGWAIRCVLSLTQSPLLIGKAQVKANPTSEFSCSLVLLNLSNSDSIPS